MQKLPTSQLFPINLDTSAIPMKDCGVLNLFRAFEEAPLEAGLAVFLLEESQSLAAKVKD